MPFVQVLRDAGETKQGGAGHPDRNPKPTCWIFATQGHDLAIPTSWAFLDKPGIVTQCKARGQHSARCATATAPATGRRETFVLSDILPRVDCAPAHRFDRTNGAAILWEKDGTRVVPVLKYRNLKEETGNVGDYLGDPDRVRINTGRSRRPVWVPATQTTVYFKNVKNISDAEVVCIRGRTSRHKGMIAGERVSRCGATPKYGRVPLREVV